MVPLNRSISAKRANKSNKLTYSTCYSVLDMGLITFHRPFCTMLLDSHVYSRHDCFYGYLISFHWLTQLLKSHAFNSFKGKCLRICSFRRKLLEFYRYWCCLWGAWQINRIFQTRYLHADGVVNLLLFLNWISQGNFHVWLL